MGITDQKEEQWIQVARKYNRAVAAATEQLMKDADGILTPAKMQRLKGWFAEGLNREINQLLYSKGLGKTKPQWPAETRAERATPASPIDTVR